MDKPVASYLYEISFSWLKNWNFELKPEILLLNSERTT